MKIKKKQQPCVVVYKNGLVLTIGSLSFLGGPLNPSTYLVETLLHDLFWGQKPLLVRRVGARKPNTAHRASVVMGFGRDGCKCSAAHRQQPVRTTGHQQVGLAMSATFLFFFFFLFLHFISFRRGVFFGFSMIIYLLLDLMLFFFHVPRGSNTYMLHGQAMPISIYGVRIYFRCFIPGQFWERGYICVCLWHHS